MSLVEQRVLCLPPVTPSGPAGLAGLWLEVTVVVEMMLIVAGKVAGTIDAVDVTQ